MKSSLEALRLLQLRNDFKASVAKRKLAFQPLSDEYSNLLGSNPDEELAIEAAVRSHNLFDLPDHVRRRMQVEEMKNLSVTSRLDNLQSSVMQGNQQLSTDINNLDTSLLQGVNLLRNDNVDLMNLLKGRLGTQTAQLVQMNANNIKNFNALLKELTDTKGKIKGTEITQALKDLKDSLELQFQNALFNIATQGVGQGGPPITLQPLVEALNRIEGKVLTETQARQIMQNINLDPVRGDLQTITGILNNLVGKTVSAQDVQTIVSQFGDFPTSDQIKDILEEGNKKMQEIMTNIMGKFPEKGGKIIEEMLEEGIQQYNDILANMTKDLLKGESPKKSPKKGKSPIKAEPGPSEPELTTEEIGDVVDRFFVNNSYNLTGLSNLLKVYSPTSYQKFEEDHFGTNKRAYETSKKQ